MNFGGVTSEEDSFEIMQQAGNGGINFFETANVYYDGEGERIAENCGPWRSPYEDLPILQNA